MYVLRKLISLDEEQADLPEPIGDVPTHQVGDGQMSVDRTARNNRSCEKLT